MNNITAATKQRALKEVFGFTAFRPLQLEVVDKILAGEDVLLVLPTGGGKSLCYQLPALLMEGVLVVVSPLLALMQDQVHGLAAKGIKAAMMSSMQDFQELNTIEKQLREESIKIVFVAPERLQNQQFLQFLRSIKIAFFAIDEAHCVSEWGHEFRADYRQLGLLKTNFPSAGIAAFTATATSKVESDIVQQLQFSQANIVRGEIYRDNLFIHARSRIKNGRQQLLDFLANHQNEQGIIYTLSRKNTESLSSFLQDHGIKAQAYHAGLDTQERRAAFTRFVNDDVDIMVATIAFGMGIDKSNIRFVVHMSLPKTLEAYYQEMGRAGRDGLPCEVLLLYASADLGVLRRFIDDIEDAAYRNLAYKKLNNIKQYAFSEACRHQALSVYFDDQMAACKTQCDNCLNPDTERTDISEQAKMFLSAVYRTGQNFGQGYIMEVLTGAKNKRVLANRHDQLSVYNIGNQTSKDQWRIIGDRLLELDVLVLAGEFSVLKLTKAAKPVLNSTQVVDIRSANLATKAPKASKQTAPTDYQVDPEILQALTALRRKIAAASNMPAYVIFDNKALREMAYFLPNNEQRLLQINGVGQVKLEKYGDQFLTLLRQFRSDDFVEPKLEPVAATPETTSKTLHNTYQTTLDLINQGHPLATICEQRELATSTVLKHINQLTKTAAITPANRDKLFSQVPTNEAINQWIQQGLELADSIEDIYHYLGVFKQLNEDCWAQI